VKTVVDLSEDRSNFVKGLYPSIVTINKIDDVVFLNITYPGGVLANIHVSWLNPYKIRRMTVVRSNKMAVLGKHMDFDNSSMFNFNHRSGDVVLPKIKWNELLKVEIEHFVDCIQTGTECLTGVEHAKEVVKILSLAMYGDK